MLDLHCHILPGIDDGPPDPGASLQLARDAAAEGVQTIAATPHCRVDHPGVVPGELAERTARLQEQIHAHAVPMEIVTAGEVDLIWSTEASDDDLRLVSYGQRGTDLLLESPYGPIPASFERLLYDLMLRGFRLLLAHPERNATFQSDIDRVTALVDLGILVQVTASSLVRTRKRSRSATAARKLLESGLAHVIASDAHGPAVPGRATLREGLEAAADMVGAERARWLVETAPRAILTGEPLPPGPPVEKASMGPFGR